MNGFNIKDFIKNNKLIFILSIVIIIVIIGLIVGIIITNVNNNNNNNVQDVSEGEASETMSSSGEGSEGGTESDGGMSAEDIARDQYLTVLHQNTMEEAEKIASVKPINASAIINLFRSGIDECFAKGDSNYASTFILDGTIFLIDNGLKQDALNMLLSLDWNFLKGKFHDAELYRQYTKVIELADELGDTATAEKFKDLRKSVEEAHRIDVGDTSE